MPKISLTVGVCENYRLKIIATRNKAELVHKINVRFDSVIGIDKKGNLIVIFHPILKLKKKLLFIELFIILIFDFVVKTIKKILRLLYNYKI